ncbi:MAG: SOS response-associated peptidase family protein [Verrucomicrobia bacterium]|nr:SOS response-associated peptidase family protein [Verrucomicrobiota bacterium]
MVNAREDKLEGGMWREAMEKRRCLIPVTGYYEWSCPQGNKRTHFFRHAGGDWLWIAGVWEEDAELGRCFSMITTSPSGVVRGVHARMSAVLSPEETQLFLEGEMKIFRPGAGMLTVEDAVNPLTGRKPGAVQGGAVLRMELCRFPPRWQEYTPCSADCNRSAFYKRTPVQSSTGSGAMMPCSTRKWSAAPTVISKFPWWTLKLKKL